MRRLLELEGRRFFHGTSAISAICIASEGFRILDRDVRFWYGHLGVGIYVTRSLREALLFGGCEDAWILEVEFTSGTRIARLEDGSDRRLLDVLRREFGHEILTARFPKAVPGNKHLKPRELFALIGHLHRSGALGSREAKRHVRKWLQRLDYHGYGHARNDVGIVLFDPSRLKLVEVWRLPHVNSADVFDDAFDLRAPDLDRADATEMLQVAERQLAKMAANVGELEQDDEYEGDVDKIRTELAHRRRLLDRYKQSSATDPRRARG